MGEMGIMGWQRALRTLGALESLVGHSSKGIFIMVSGDSCQDILIMASGDFPSKPRGNSYHGLGGIFED